MKLYPMGGEAVPLTVSSPKAVTLATKEGSNVPSYRGEYEFTPSDEAQTIPIMGMRATQDITINPIPNNYGLITWDGSTLTVS